jgi:hypothetical protein
VKLIDNLLSSQHNRYMAKIAICLRVDERTKKDLTKLAEASRISVTQLLTVAISRLLKRQVAIISDKQITYDEVGAIFEISRQRVYALVKKYRETGSVDWRFKVGRPKKKETNYAKS